jgi:uncharacterized membrane protein
LYAELLLLRLVHILGGITWVGGGIYASFFLIPALSATPPLIPQVMAGLQRRRTFVILPTIGLLTVLTGLRLMWIDSAGVPSSYFSTGTGMTFGIGGIAALIALVVQVFIQRPAGVKLGAIAASLAVSTSADEKQRLTAEADRLRRRNILATTVAVRLGLFAAAAMAIARYV